MTNNNISLTDISLVPLILLIFSQTNHNIGGTIGTSYFASYIKYFNFHGSKP